MNIIFVPEARKMSSVTDPDSSMPASAAADMPAAMPAVVMPSGRKRGQPLAGQFIVKCNHKPRLRWWDQLCGDRHFHCLMVGHVARCEASLLVFRAHEVRHVPHDEAVLSAEKHVRGSTPSATNLHKANEAKAAAGIAEKLRRMALLRVVAVPENQRLHEVRYPHHTACTLSQCHARTPARAHKCTHTHAHTLTRSSKRTLLDKSTTLVSAHDARK